jgi:hypothetical protein
MLGGMKTLAWAIVLFLLVVYVASLVFRELFGFGQVEAVTIYFETVPRAMFTTFRCSFGDCTTDGGTPIFEDTYSEAFVGYSYSLLYCGFVFFISIGLFNVIAAIFVESTMNAAAALEKSKKTERNADRLLWARNVTAFISCMREIAANLANQSSTCPAKMQMSTHTMDVISEDFPATLINECVKDPRAKEALRNLEINEDDYEHLSDILDPDNGGSLGVLDVIDGLNRLRGDPRRSDIVSVDLMIRSMQVSFREMHRDLQLVLASVSKRNTTC